MRASRAILRINARHVEHELRAAGAFVPSAEGAFYLFPSFEAHRDVLAARGITGGAELCDGLLRDTGGAALPGSAFGRPASELTLRVALVDFDGAETLGFASEVSSERLESTLVSTHCPNIATATEKLCGWVSG